MTVAIHQPNYLPWLGYFAKIARCRFFVFLDDVQFSKGSYTNRVQICRDQKPAWLSVPIRHEFKAPIFEIVIAQPGWVRSHRDALRQAYRHAAAFGEVWPLVESWLRDDLPESLALVNIALIRAISDALGFSPVFLRSSDLAVDAVAADERLAAIVSALSPGGEYLSGAGGAKYQAEEIFSASGLTLRYSDFEPRPYARTDEPFVPGLSILDALFHLGLARTAALIRP